MRAFTLLLLHKRCLYGRSLITSRISSLPYINSAWGVTQTQEDRIVLDLLIVDEKYKANYPSDLFFVGRLEDHANPLITRRDDHPSLVPIHLLSDL